MIQKNFQYKIIKDMKNSILTIAILTALVSSSCNETSKQAKPEETSTVTSNSKMNNGVNLFVGSWVQPNPINEREVQGFILKEDGTAESINMATLIYKNWWTKEGKLFIVAESLGNGTSSIDTIQYDIMKNTETELELKQGDYTDKYTKQ